MRDAIRVGIIGDFNARYLSHRATDASLLHAAARLNLRFESSWLPTPSLAGPEAAGVLESCDGLWAAPVSPYQSMEGMLQAIEFARRRGRPFVAT